jgi:hypothetical protein
MGQKFVAETEGAKVLKVELEMFNFVLIWR